MKKFPISFHADDFSESAMPIASMLCRMFDEAYCNTVSAEMAACMEKYEEIYDKFFHSLDESQQQMFEKFDGTTVKVTAIETVEHFNRGLVIGGLLTREILLGIIHQEHQQ